MNKIICTVGGKSSNTHEILDELKSAGMEIARINLSHATIESARPLIKYLKSIGCEVLLDTQGSKIRLGKCKDGIIEFKPGVKVTIQAEPCECTAEKISLNHKEVVPNLTKGLILHMDDSNIIFKVIETHKDHVICEVESGGKITSGQGVFVPQSVLPLPNLTAYDKQVAKIAEAENVDWLALSFVKCGADIDELRALCGNKVKIASKIECKEAFPNLIEIIQKSDALIIDRGDLGSEVEVEKVPFLQKIVLQKSKTLGKPVFLASHVLSKMCDKPKPTRAEVNDVITSIMDGASGFVLAEETAVGKYPVKTVKFLKKLYEHASLVNDLADPSMENVVKRLEELNYL